MPEKEKGQLHTFHMLSSHSFEKLQNGINSDGARPYGGLILSGNTLYGTTYEGGSGGNGTVFALALSQVVTPPNLTITPSGAGMILTWPTNFTGFTLELATNLASPVWTPVSAAPAIANGQRTVTNPISGTQQFFRLSR